MSVEISNREDAGIHTEEKNKTVAAKKELSDQQSGLDLSPNVGEFSLDLVNSSLAEKWMLSAKRKKKCSS